MPSSAVDMSNLEPVDVSQLEPVNQKPKSANAGPVDMSNLAPVDMSNLEPASAPHAPTTGEMLKSTVTGPGTLYSHHGIFDPTINLSNLMQGGPAPRNTPEAIAKGITGATLDVASGFTSPGQLGLMLGTAGILNPIDLRLGMPVLRTLMASGFSIDMIRKGLQQVPELQQAWKQHNWEGLTRGLGNLLVNGFFAGESTRHAMGGLEQVLPAARTDAWSAAHSGAFERTPSAKPAAPPPGAAETAAPPPVTPPPVVTPPPAAPPSPAAAPVDVSNLEPVETPPPAGPVKRLTWAEIDNRAGQILNRWESGNTATSEEELGILRDHLARSQTAAKGKAGARYDQLDDTQKQRVDNLLEGLRRTYTPTEAPTEIPPSVPTPPPPAVAAEPQPPRRGLPETPRMPAFVQGEATPVNWRQATPEERARLIRSAPPATTPVETPSTPVESPAPPAAVEQETPEVDPRTLAVDPVRFQYKMGTGGEHGVSDLLKGESRYDPKRGGILAVWRDPADGKTYVVNGHHRLELALRTGAPRVTVRYLDAPTAAEARMQGAIINISEGRGTPIDAAKVFRDGGLSPEELAREVNLREGVARDGLALSKLAPSIFDRVVQGDIPVQRAVLIGDMLDSFDEQKQALSLLEKSGRRLTNNEARELIRFVKGAPKEEQQAENLSLFGEDTITKSLALEKAEISAYIKDQLSKERRLFGATGTAGAAERLGRAGNVIKAEENARIAQEAAQAQAVYDKLSLSAGPISDALDQAARDLAAGKSEKQVKQEAYERVRQAVSETLAGSPRKGPPGGEEPPGGAGPAPGTPEPAGGGGEGPSLFGPATDTGAPEPQRSAEAEGQREQEVTSAPARPDGVQLFSVPQSGMHFIIAAHPDFHEGPVGTNGVAWAARELKRRGLAPENVLGSVSLMPHGTPAVFKPGYVEVHPSWQRKGIASAMYQLGEQATGQPITPSEFQTPEGQAFSKARRGGLPETPPVPENLQPSSAETPAKKPKGLPFRAQQAVNELKEIWANAQKIGDAAAKHQVRAYTDKSPEAQEAARQNAIEHHFSFPSDIRERALADLEDFRQMARERGLDPEEYLRDAGLPERWLQPSAPTEDYPTHREQNALNQEIRDAYNNLGKGDAEARAALNNAFESWQDGNYRLAKRFLDEARKLTSTPTEVPPSVDEEGQTSIVTPEEEQASRQDEKERQGQLEARQATQEIQFGKGKALDSGNESIEDSPLFGGPRQQTLLGGGLGAAQPYVESFWQRDVLPRLQAFAKGTTETANLLAKVLAPRRAGWFRSRVSDRGLTALYRMKGGIDEATALLDRQLDSWRGELRGMSGRDKVQFVDRIKRGQAIANQSLDALRQFMRQADDYLHQEISKHRSLQYLEDHWRVMYQEPPAWEDPNTNRPIDRKQQFFGRRPLRGSMGFSRKHFLDDWTEGLEWIVNGRMQDLQTRAGDAQLTANDVAFRQGPQGQVSITPFSAPAREWLVREEAKGLQVRQRGGNPTTWDPIEMYQRHYADATKYIYAQRMWNEFQRQGLIKYVRGMTTPIPPDYVKVDDAIANRYLPQPKGAQIGYYVIEENVGRLLNNYLSRDLIRGTALGRFAMGLKNWTTAIELGISPFHAVFEANETIGSSLGLGFRQLYTAAGKALVERNLPAAGRMASAGLHEIASAVPSGIPFLRGEWAERIPGLATSAERTGATARQYFRDVGPAAGKMRELEDQEGELLDRLQRMRANNPAYQRTQNQLAVVRADLAAARGDFQAAERAFAQSKTGAGFLNRFPNAAEYLHDWFMGGGRLSMHEDYKINAQKNIRQAFLDEWRAGNPIGALGLRGLPAMNELILSPLFDTMIPNMKVSAFLKEWHQELIENQHKLQRGEISRDALLRRTVDSIENRFGEMNFDNLFWNRTFKSATQLLFRSVTWKLGNLRATGGAMLAGIPRTATDLVRSTQRGEAPALDPNLAWALGMAVWTSVLGTLISKGVGHVNPQSFKDLVYPIVDAVNNIRVSLPTYFRDWIHLAHSPGGYLKSGESGEIGRIIDILQNRDFYGTEVRHPDDPWYQQAGDVIGHLAPLPFSIQSYRSASQEGGSTAARDLGLLGFTKAPGYISQSNALQQALQFRRENIPQGTRTRQQADTSRLRLNLTRQVRAGRDVSDQVQRLLQQGKLTEQDLDRIGKQAQLSDLQSVVQPLRLDQAVQVYELATPQEREEIGDLLVTKISNALEKNPEQVSPSLWLRLQKLGFIDPGTQAPAASTQAVQ